MANAAVTAQQAARLGADLTPMGAEKAGNAAGTIPAWTGGHQVGGRRGRARTSSRAATIPTRSPPTSRCSRSTPRTWRSTPTNLTAGHKALLDAYKSSYFMNVYPAHRSAAFPQRIYDATKANRDDREADAESGNGVTGAIDRHAVPDPADRASR